jgi:hypothetical protein
MGRIPSKRPARVIEPIVPLVKGRCHALGVRRFNLHAGVPRVAIRVHLGWTLATGGDAGRLFAGGLTS